MVAMLTGGQTGHKQGPLRPNKIKQTKQKQERGRSKPERAKENPNDVTGRNRHFCVKMAWLREQVAAKMVRFVFVASRNNVADIFTKILPPDVHARLVKALLNPKVVSSRGEC